MKPIGIIIAGYTQIINAKEFWQIFGKLFEEATSNCENQLNIEIKGINEEEYVEPSGLLHISNIVDEILSNEKQELDSKANVYLFRLRLCEIMKLFPQVCESQSIIVVPFFFRFLSNEYRYKFDDEIIIEKEIFTNQRNLNPQFNRQKVLLSFLKLFSMYTQPKTQVNERQLYKLYLELLKSNDNSIQKMAFECLMTYKFSYLSPYKGNFTSLIEEKSFREEIVLFSFSEENCVVDKKHRDQILPILLRLLVGKMVVKKSKETNNRKTSMNRLNIILNFILSLKSDEISVFLDFLFIKCKFIISDSRELLTIMQEIFEEGKHSIIPFKKQLSILSNVGLVLDKLGSKIRDYLDKILRLLLNFGANANHYLISNRKDLPDGIINQIKNIRTSVLEQILNFFEIFPDYELSFNKVEALFMAVVLPQIYSIHLDCVISYNSLLKLIVVWSQNSKFHCYLAKQIDSNTVLGCILKLLNWGVTSKSVIQMVLDVVLNLLVEEQMHNIAEISIGTKLVLKYLPQILEYLQIVIDVASKKSDKKNSLRKELHILSILSKYVERGEFSEQIISQLISLLACEKSVSYEMQSSIILSVKHLLHQSNNCQLYIGKIAVLFNSIIDRNNRQELCEVLKIIGKSTKLLSFDSIIEKLNSWDKKHLNEPDYIQRIEGFEEAISIIKNIHIENDNNQTTINQSHMIKFIDATGKDLSLLEDFEMICDDNADDNIERTLEMMHCDDDVDVTIKDDDILNLVLLILYNAVHFLTYSEDIAIRDRSFDCLVIIAEKASISSPFSILINKHILPLIKINLKNKNEITRNGFICLTRKLIQYLLENSQLRSISFLVNEIDDENDFFLNVTHIQTHRRSRALKRLAKYLNEMSPEQKNNIFLINALSSYILSIIIAFLRDETTNTDVLDGAIEALGAVSNILDWNRYKLLLISRLKLLTTKSVTNQKLAVRCLVAILDGFHFDIQNSEFHSLKNDENIEVTEDDSKINIDDKIIKEAAHSLTICSNKLAANIHKTLVKYIFPELHRLLTNKTKSDDQHKLADAGKYAEDEEILRAPIALAMIKLLKILPTIELDRNLNGILIRICHFLGSRSKDIRTSARETIKKILYILSPDYFHVLVFHMKTHLLKGYQRHVLSFSVWSLLNDLKEKTKEDKTYFLPEHIEPAIINLTEIFNEEIFGEMAEEKKVEAITNNLFEARQTKSFESYKLMISFIDTRSLPKVISPLKKILENIRNHTGLKKMGEVFIKISKGLLENNSLNIEYTLTLIFTLTSESLDECSDTKSSILEYQYCDPRLKPPSSLIISKPAPRGGLKPKSDIKSNLFILVEFGYNLLYMMLKNPLMQENIHLNLIDPFIPIITKSMESKNSKVKIASLKCLTFIMRLQLPSLEREIIKFVENIFIILKQFAMIGTGKTENSDLVTWAFKCICSVLQYVAYYNVTTDQLQILLTYVEQDLQDYTKHATAFPLLQAILSRKLVSKELIGIIKMVEDMSIKSESSEVQNKCRKIVLTYLLDYPLDIKQMRTHVKFYSRQLDYEYENGRISAIQMLYSLANTFPKEILSKHVNIIFLKLCQSRLNDDSTTCLDLIVNTLKILLSKIYDSEKDQLRNLVIGWLKNSKVSLIMLSSMILGIFIEVEQKNFDCHIVKVLDVLADHLHTENFNKVILSDIEQQNTDRLLYNLLDLFFKLITNTGILFDKVYKYKVNEIWDYCQIYLKYDYDMVQLKAGQLFNKLLSDYKVDDFIFDSQNSMNSNYLLEDADRKLYDLCGSFCYQLSPLVLKPELVSIVSKNLLLLFRIINNIQNGFKKILINNVDDKLNSKKKILYVQAKYSHQTISQSKTISEQRPMIKSEVNKKLIDSSVNKIRTINLSVANSEHLSDDDKIKTTSVDWLLKRLNKEIFNEVKNNQNSTVKRKTIYVLYGAIAKDLGVEFLNKYIAFLMKPLMREISDQSSNKDNELNLLVQEIFDLFKKIIGPSKFSFEYSRFMKKITDKKESNKALKLQKAVTNPEVYARRKMKTNLAKKESRKRKNKEMKMGNIKRWKEDKKDILLLKNYNDI